jgi:hypothetical protein
MWARRAYSRGLESEREDPGKGRSGDWSFPCCRRGDAANDLIGRLGHGRSVNPFADSGARADGANATGGAATVLGLGAGGAAVSGAKGLATGLGVSSTIFGIPSVANQGADLVNNWGHLTPGQRVAGSAELAASIGLTAAPSFAGKLAPKEPRPAVSEPELRPGPSGDPDVSGCV